MLNGLAANCEQLMQAIAGAFVLEVQCLWEKVQVVSRPAAKKVGEFTTVTFTGGHPDVQFQHLLSRENTCFLRNPLISTDSN